MVPELRGGPRELRRADSADLASGTVGPPESPEIRKKSGFRLKNRVFLGPERSPAGVPRMGSKPGKNRVFQAPERSLAREGLWRAVRGRSGRGPPENPKIGHFFCIFRKISPPDKNSGKKSAHFGKFPLGKCKKSANFATFFFRFFRLFFRSEKPRGGTIKFPKVPNYPPRVLVGIPPIL